MHIFDILLFSPHLGLLLWLCLLIIDIIIRFYSHLISFLFLFSAGRFILMTSLYDRLGGHVLRWSNLRGQEWAGSTLPLNHDGHFYNVEIPVRRYEGSERERERGGGAGGSWSYWLYTLNLKEWAGYTLPLNHDRHFYNVQIMIRRLKIKKTFLHTLIYIYNH